MKKGSVRLCASTAHINFFFGNHETKFLEKVKIFVKSADSLESHTALPTQCAISHSTLSSESKPTLAKVLSGFASTIREFQPCPFCFRIFLPAPKPSSRSQTTDREGTLLPI
jgi:hypothetical protein